MKRNYFENLFSGASSNAQKSDVIDVDFQDLSSSHGEKSSKPNNAASERRSKQISRAAIDKFKPIMEQDPMFALLNTLFFSAGAKWADEHPAGEFKSEYDRQLAAQEESRRMVPDSEQKRDLRLDAIQLLVFLDGIAWADNNPPEGV